MDLIRKVYVSLNGRTFFVLGDSAAHCDEIAVSYERYF
jgi:hypothetical protein